MLEFLVLGQIPGTQLHIDFNDLRFIAGDFIMLIIALRLIQLANIHPIEHLGINKKRSA